MSETYKKPLLFISVILTLSLILFSFLIVPFYKVMIDVVFMTGLAVLLLGGFLWIVDKGVYSRIFINFKKYLKRTSKMESYVDNYEVESMELTKEKKGGVPFYMIISGINLITISAILAII